jgi:hypothetical protein
MPVPEDAEQCEDRTAAKVDLVRAWTMHVDCWRKCFIGNVGSVHMEIYVRDGHQRLVELSWKCLDSFRKYMSARLLTAGISVALESRNEI